MRFCHWLLLLFLKAKDVFTSGSHKRLISKPDNPTKVFIGSNVSLLWRFYAPAHRPLVEVVFGNYKGYRVYPIMMTVNGRTGIPKVTTGYESAISWAGNLTSSLVVFVLHNVQPEYGNVDFGIRFVFGILITDLYDTVRLKVVEKPTVCQPQILHITIPPLLRIGESVNLSCTANGSSFVNVTWHKGGKEVVTNYGNGTSTAMFELYNITSEDWGECLCVAKNSVGEARKTVFLKVLPASPVIRNTNKITRNASWILSWSAVSSEGHLVTTYTVWHRVWHNTLFNISRKESWMRRNVTGFVYYTELAANTSYMFAVTAWNKWGESDLEIEKILIVSTNFTDKILAQTMKTTLLLVSTKPLNGMTMSPTSRRNRNKKEGTNSIIIAMTTLSVILALLITVAFGLMWKREKLRVCRKEKEKNSTENQGSRTVTRLSFASQLNLTSESAQAANNERCSAVLSGLSLPLQELTLISEQSPTSGTCTDIQEHCSQPITGECYLHASFSPGPSGVTHSFAGKEQRDGPSLRTFFPLRGNESTRGDVMSVMNSATSEEKNKMNLESSSTSKVAIKCVTEVSLRKQVETGRFQQIPDSDDYLQPVDSENVQIKKTATSNLSKNNAKNKRPQTKPMFKDMDENENKTTFNASLLSLQFTEIEGSQSCTNATSANQPTIIYKTNTSNEANGYQNERRPAVYQNAVIQGFFVQPRVIGDSTYANVYCNANWEIPHTHLRLQKKIGGGSFGQVWKGQVSDVTGTGERSVVAVKMLKENFSKSDLKDLLSELDLLKKLKPHPNVIRLLGCVTKDVVRCKGKREIRPPLVVLEFAPYGDLLGFLRKSKGQYDDYYNLRGKHFKQKLTKQQLYQFAADIARGMDYIAAHQLVHRDLAARNVLLGDGLRCKITDFGMAREMGKDEIYIRKTNGLVPIKWMAVESLKHRVYTTESDVWSYGIVLYEIFTLGECPYEGMVGEEVFSFVTSGLRMQRTSAISPDLYKLMLKCWNEELSKRPTFSTIVSWMENPA